MTYNGWVQQRMDFEWMDKRMDGQMKDERCIRTDLMMD